MAQYLKFSSPSGAVERSKSLWEEFLGHPADENATTQYLYGVVESDTESYLIISDDGDLLTEEETDALDPEATFRDWESANFPSDDD
ncbi:MAG: hypothetical protein CMM47_01670 [Rhodospirillaceae bacterium]|nr:hypothetical protein [Rhodospirillaceae bacterium]|tara:strand:- start:1021 stop:1281 length:261 start_codon:yes stop_codon:yes gene_type:complete